MATLPKLNLNQAAKLYSQKKKEDFTKSLKKKVSPKNIAKVATRPIISAVSKELPEISSLFSSIGSEFSEFKKFMKKQSDSTTKKVKTTQSGFAANQNQAPSLIPVVIDVLKEHTTYLEKITVELQTLTEMTRQAWGISELQLDMTRRTFEQTQQQSKLTKLNQQKQAAQSKIKPAGSGLIKPKAKPEEKNFFKQIFEALGLGFLSRGFLSLLTGVTAITGILTGIATLVGGIVTGIVADLS